MFVPGLTPHFLIQFTIYFFHIVSVWVMSSTLKFHVLNALLYIIVLCSLNHTCTNAGVYPFIRHFLRSLHSAGPGNTEQRQSRRFTVITRSLRPLKWVSVEASAGCNCTKVQKCSHQSTQVRKQLNLRQPCWLPGALITALSSQHKEKCLKVPSIKGRHKNI